jgi:hypothetical protein
MYRVTDHQKINKTHTCVFIGSVGHWVIGSLGHWVIGSFGIRSSKVTPRGQDISPSITSPCQGMQSSPFRPQSIALTLFRAAESEMRNERNSPYANSCTRQVSVTVQSDTGLLCPQIASAEARARPEPVNKLSRKEPIPTIHFRSLIRTTISTPIKIHGSCSDDIVEFSHQSRIFAHLTLFCSIPYAYSRLPTPTRTAACQLQRAQPPATTRTAACQLQRAHTQTKTKTNTSN